MTKACSLEDIQPNHLSSLKSLPEDHMKARDKTSSSSGLFVIIAFGMKLQ